MTLAEEKALLRRFTKAAGAGEMLNILELKAAYQAAIGRATRPNQFIIGNHGSREEVIAIRQLALRHAGTPNAARPDWRTPWQSLAVLVRARARVTAILPIAELSPQSFRRNDGAPPDGWTCHVLGYGPPSNSARKSRRDGRAEFLKPT